MVKHILVASLLLMVCACTPPTPVPYPGPEELAAAHYGEYPDNYLRIIQNSSFMSNRHPMTAKYDFSGPPARLAMEYFGRYEFGWGGYVSISYDPSSGPNRDLGNAMFNVPFRYLIRDGKLVIFENLSGFPLP